MWSSLPGHDLLPPSSLLRLTDVQQSGPNWIRADGLLTDAGRLDGSTRRAHFRDRRLAPR